MTSAAYAWVQDEPKRLCATLKTRERDVLILLAKGMSAREAGDCLCIAVATVKDSTKAIYRKFDVHTIQEAAVIAAKAGLV